MAQELTITVHWNAVFEKPNILYLFPHRFGQYFRKHHKTAAIYRWRVVPSAPEQTELVYIGQADDLHRRIQRVLTPSKSGRKGDTNLRLHQLFVEASASGDTVLLETASFDDFTINGVLFSPSTIKNEFVRCAVESILVRLAEKEETAKLLNRRLSERRVQEMLQQLQSLPAHQRAAIMREVIARVGDKPGDVMQGQP